ncbi:MAG: histidinol dehydrogenase [Candidatus Goldiibacteriota bacterium HGW-Goldbacteria-1]|jgi:histidinol dehydrogenase|nr:MAG: histidinol dehydrogenase [Candidatus Goldiibacteriota bacterium HGW-Goldbacteria-1]
MIKRFAYTKRNSNEIKEYLKKIDAFSAKVPDSVLEIIDDVRKNGDAALFDYAQKFDKAKIKSLKVKGSDIKKAYTLIDKSLIKAIRVAAKNISDFHRLQKENIKGYTYKNEGYTIEQKYLPLDSAGIYIPGGQAPLFSTVLMAGIPAITAGVKRICIVSPPRYNSEVNPYVLVAADIIGIKEIYRAGGAQAVAALAYGTKSITKVNKVVGPGNIYSTGAKKELFGTIGIDSINGPSEVTVIADETADPQFILFDLLAQAEHVNGHSVLITTSRKLADFIETGLKKESKLNITAVIITVKSLAQAAGIANEKGPEHLTVITKKDNAVIDGITNAPAIFAGNYSPVAFGDYMAGANHILPTNGTSKFFSGLSVLDFMKHTHIVRCTKKAIEKFGPLAEQMAETETLLNHKRSIEIRRKK